MNSRVGRDTLNSVIRDGHIDLTEADFPMMSFVR